MALGRKNTASSGKGKRRSPSRPDAQSAKELFAELVEAVKDLGRLQRHAPSATDVNGVLNWIRGVQRSAQRAENCLDELVGEVSGGSHAHVDDSLETQDGREAAGLSRAKPRMPTRHDAKRPPSGCVYESWSGELLRKMVLPSVDTETLRRANRQAKSILLTLSCWYTVRLKGGAQANLDSVLRQLVHSAQPTGLVHQRVAEIGRAFAAILHPPDQEKWEELLAIQLESDALHREEERLREAHGWTGPDPGSPFTELNEKLSAELEELAPQGAHWRPATGEEILACLRDHEIELPPELTADAIDKMRKQVTLNKGGRHGGKLAATVVREFVESIRGKKAQETDS